MLRVAFRARAEAETLHKPKGVAIWIVDVQLACPPALIDGSLMDFCGSVWVSRCLQTSGAEPVKQSVNIVGQHEDCLSERAVPGMARQTQQRPSPHENTEGGIAVATMLDTLEVEHLYIIDVSMRLQRTVGMIAIALPEDSVCFDRQRAAASRVAAWHRAVPARAPLCLGSVMPNE